MPGRNRFNKGRGALHNPDNRYQPLSVEPLHDADDSDAPPTTEYTPVQARSIIARNKSPDVPFDRSINPFQGCEHGCVYCYARPTHAYLDLSPGLDFETRINYKINAAARLRQELAKPGYTCQPITLGANTDPYQQVEKQLGITRALLETLQQCRHPFSIISKGALLTRDLDIFAEMAADGLCSVAISVTTLDLNLKRLLEPRAASHNARLNAIEQLSNAGVPVTLLFAPVIPALNDSDMEQIVTQGAAAGAQSAAMILLRLPLEIRELFHRWLQQHYPQRAQHVISLLRQCRGGADNDSRFGQRMRGTGPVAELLQQRFHLACKRNGLTTREEMELRTDLFRPPATVADSGNAVQSGQIDLFSS